MVGDLDKHRPNLNVLSASSPCGQVNEFDTNATWWLLRAVGRDGEMESNLRICHTCRTRRIKVRSKDFGIQAKVDLTADSAMELCQYAKDVLNLTGLV